MSSETRYVDWLDRDVIIDEFRHLAAMSFSKNIFSPGFSTDDPTVSRFEQRKHRADQERRNDSTKEVNPKMEKEPDTPEEFAKLLQLAINDNPKVFTLVAPVVLTARRLNGTFTKISHVGGEGFRISDVYVGKRGKLIFVFSPTEAAVYPYVEMDEYEAAKVLCSFEEYMRKIGGSEYSRMRKEAAEKASLEAERRNLDKREEYKDLGFGSW